MIHGPCHGYRLVHRSIVPPLSGALSALPDRRAGRGLSDGYRYESVPAPLVAGAGTLVLPLGRQPTEVTVPAPTVRPPSRIAKPSPGSNGTSRPSSTVIVTVSPGRATARSPRSTSPTTSAVRM